MYSLLCLLGLSRVRPQHQQSAATLQLRQPATSGIFDRIPPGITQQIASWLPHSSAAALALCSHKLNHLLGDQYLLALRQGESSMSERMLFLQALDQDVPGAFYCYYCIKLHLVQKPGTGLTPEERFRWASESRCSGADGAYNYGATYNYHAQFRFEHLQVAMKLYRRGLVSDTIAYLNCLTLIGPIRRDMSIFPKYLGFYFFEPRIVDGQIFVRAQSRSFIPEGQGFIPPIKQYTTVCAHLDAHSRDSQFVTALKCKAEHFHHKQDSCAQCQDLIRCEYCPTEVCVDIRKSGKGHVENALVVTKWQVLGYGLSPFESQWKSHLKRHSIRWQWPSQWELGSVLAAFEAQSGVKHDSILDPDKAWTLLNERG